MMLMGRRSRIGSKPIQDWGRRYRLSPQRSYRDNIIVSMQLLVTSRLGFERILTMVFLI